MTLSVSVVAAPPVTLWPEIERHGQLPPDLEEFVAALEHAVWHAHAPDGAGWIVKRRW